jgi:CubicO group peptidase (beta-lactamase class C family)
MSHALPRSSPEAQGVPSGAILAFVDAAERQLDTLHSLMILRHGQVVAEGWWKPYARDLPHLLFSLSKSFTSTAVGFAVAEGHLSLDDRVLAFFPEDAPPEPDPHQAALQVRHLLTMTTGHAADTIGALYEDPEGNWARGFFSQPLEHAPGTHFVYNSGATYMLSAILQRLTGENLLEYLQPRLFEPVGIGGATWETCPRGIAIGGWGLSATTEAVARLGQLYLQRGVWRGRQVLPAGWAEQATAGQVANGSSPESDWEQGYGYQFWRCRHGAYRGDGAFGQFCVVLPEQDTVFVTTAGLGDMQAVLNLVWQHLLPALEPEPLPEDGPALEALRQKLAGLALPAARGLPSPPTAAQVSGASYALGENDRRIETVTCVFEEGGARIAIRDWRGVHELVCGHGEWRAGSTTLPPVGPQPCAASGAWTAPDTYVVQQYITSGPFRATLTLRFAEDRLLYDFGLNLSFYGPTSFPQLEGRRGPAA